MNVHSCVGPLLNRFTMSPVCVCIVEFCLSESRREVNSSYNWTLRDSGSAILVL